MNQVRKQNIWEVAELAVMQGGLLDQGLEPQRLSQDQCSFLSPTWL